MRGAGISGRPELHSNLKGNVDYRRPFLKKKKIGIKEKLMNISGGETKVTVREACQVIRVFRVGKKRGEMMGHVDTRMLSRTD